MELGWQDTTLVDAQLTFQVLRCSQEATRFIFAWTGEDWSGVDLIDALR